MLSWRTCGVLRSGGRLVVIVGIAAVVLTLCIWPQGKQTALKEKEEGKTERTKHKISTRPAEQSTTMRMKEQLLVNMGRGKDRMKPEQNTTDEISKNQGESLAGFFNLKAAADTSFRGVSLLDAQTLFAKFCTTYTTTCSEPQRFGRAGDGGYEVCMSEPFTLQPQSCRAYSFGVGRMWDFDDALQQFGCEVHSFDPSIHLQNHTRAENHQFWNIGLWDSDMVNGKGWQLHTLNSLIKMLGHDQKVIDVVKVDIEGAEWPFLKQILTTDAIKFVKQLIFELHTPIFKTGHMTVSDYAAIYGDLTELRDKWNFQLYLDHHNNGCCGRFSVLTPAKMVENPRPLCCYELYFVNNNYL